MLTQITWLVILATLCTPVVFAADVSEYRKVDVFIEDGEGRKKKKDARLEIDMDASEIRLVDEKRGASRAIYAIIPIDKIAGLAYQPEAGGKPWGGIVTRTPDKHMLTIRSDVLPTGLIRLRLDKDNQRQLRQALREVTGILDDVWSRSPLTAR